jgi:hypothetical protein
VIGSQHRRLGSQHACTLPVSATARAALPYFCRTFSRTSLAPATVVSLRIRQSEYMALDKYLSSHI